MFIKRLFMLKTVLSTGIILSILFLAENTYAEPFKHLGVGSCSSSTCHGSNVSFANSNVLQNEFITWNEQDPHARAYKTLLSQQSIQIAQKLGLESAHTAETCLNCHADNINKELRNDDFQISDGVGCEVCHGGGENYINSHKKNTHETNLKEGLYPSEKPYERAKLCVSCHIGDQENRIINHSIMGAGHPRLSFELNTFSSIQPAHYQVDSDYIGRKGEYNQLQIWAIGQLVAAEQLLKNIQAFPRSGLFPELVHMDCLVCHQPMSKLNWSINPLTKLPAGALRYNDAHLLMCYQIARAVTPNLADKLLDNTKRFANNGIAQSNIEALIQTLLNDLNTIRLHLEENPIQPEDGENILSALIEIGLATSHQGYATAEQSVMAINSVLNAINNNDQKNKRLDGIERLFNSANDPENYHADTFISGLKRIQDTLKSSH